MDDQLKKLLKSFVLLKVLTKTNTSLSKSNPILNNKAIATHWMKMAYGEANPTEVADYTDQLGRKGHSKWELKQIPLPLIDTHHSGHDASDRYISEYSNQAQGGSPFPPVIIEPNSKIAGRFMTIDGQHRVKAAQALGHTHIPAYVPIQHNLTIKKSEPLEKMDAPIKVGQVSDDQTRVAALHPNGNLMWYAHPRIAEATDSFLLKHKNNYIQRIKPEYRGVVNDMFDKVLKDPNRHAVAAFDVRGGQPAIRARHLKSLIHGEPHVKLKAVSPNEVRLHAERHGRGLGMGEHHVMPFNNATKLAASEMFKSMMKRHFEDLGYFEKGAMRRIAPFNPHKDISEKDISNAGIWQTSPGFIQDIDTSYEDPSVHQSHRAELPRAEGAERMRMLNKLHGKTSVRINPQTGNREFLMFRGHGNQEQKNKLDSTVRHDDLTSWTPDLKIAKGFMDIHNDDRDAAPLAAWIDENNIRSSPAMYGKISNPMLDRDDPEMPMVAHKRIGPNQMSSEQEHIIDPHVSPRATKKDVANYNAQKVFRSGDKQENMLDINNRISLRGKVADYQKQAWSFPENRRNPINLVLPRVRKSEMKAQRSEDWQTAYLKKAEDQPTTLYHYSREPGLKSIDPKKMGTGTPGHYNKRFNPSQIKDFPHSSFHYVQDTPEPVVRGGARSKYTLKLSPDQELYDMSADPSGIVKNAIAANGGAWNYENVLRSIKDAGFYGIHAKSHSDPTIANTVMLFHEHPVDKEEGV